MSTSKLIFIKCRHRSTKQGSLIQKPMPRKNPEGHTKARGRLWRAEGPRQLAKRREPLNHHRAADQSGCQAQHLRGQHKRCRQAHRRNQQKNDRRAHRHDKRNLNPCARVQSDRQLQVLQQPEKQGRLSASRREQPQVPRAADRPGLRAVQNMRQTLSRVHCARLQAESDQVPAQHRLDMHSKCARPASRGVPRHKVP